MNQLTPMSGAMPQAGRARTVLDTEFTQSAEIGQLVDGLAAAMQEIHNPKRNRAVEVYSRKRGYSYTFRYATLDLVLEESRAILARHGVVMPQLVVGSKLISMLAHTSGQWLRSVIDLQLAEDGPQALGSAITYARRYAAIGLLQIAAEDDDDGNTAAGNEYRPADAVQIVHEASGDALHPVIELTRQVTDPASGRAFLRRWLDDAAVMERLRDAPDGAEVWRAMLGEGGAAVERAFGRPVALAWKAMAKASKPAHLGFLEEHWHGAWKEALNALADSDAEAFALLQQHMLAGQQRILGENLGAAPADPKPAANDAAPSANADALAANADALAANAPEEKADGFLPHALLDTAGNAISAVFDDPGIYANAFLAEWSAHDPDDRAAFERVNQAGLAACAAAGLDVMASAARAAEQAEPVAEAELAIAIAMPLTRNRPDLPRYVEQVGAMLARLYGRRGLLAFRAVNEATIADLPPKTRMRVLRDIANRAMALGISLQPDETG